MKLIDIPPKQPVPFGINGQREAILQATPAGDNSASYSNGFPPVTMILKSAGGLPPKGQNMNQILFELSGLCRWFSAGGAIPFDASFCSAISGYPKGARIIGDDGSTVYVSTVDSNTANPNTSSAGWLSLSKLTSIASLSGGSNKLPYFNGPSTAAQTDLSQVGRDIIGKTSVNAILQYLGLVNNVAVFTNPGVTTWTVPDELKNGRKAKVTVIGGGASGGRGSSGGGGGGGGVAVKVVDLSGVSSVQITVGAGGEALPLGDTATNGKNGGTSSFGSMCSATGGTSGGTQSGQSGGIGIGGDFNTSLGPGGPGTLAGGNTSNSGPGGGPGGAGTNSGNSADGNDAKGPGGGGSGAAWGTTQKNCVSGAGFNGIVIVEW